MYSIELEREMRNLEENLLSKGYGVKYMKKHVSFINGALTVGMTFEKGVKFSDVPRDMNVVLVPETKGDGIQCTVAFIACESGEDIERAVKAFKKWTTKQSICA